MRLHNRQVKATFWNDTDLLMWPREKRWFYEGLFHLADDSGCLEDSPFAFKLNLFPSPVDSDITMETIAKWRDELTEDRKLVRYVSGRKECLFISNFHKHQTLKNPEKPDVPLPPWMEFEPYESNNRTGKYKVNHEVLTEFLHTSYNALPREEKRNELEVKGTEEKRNGTFAAIAEVAATTSTPNDINSSSSLDLNYGRLTQMYQSDGFGQMTDTTDQLLQILYDEFGYEWLKEAMEEAVGQNKRRIAYVKSILQNWRADGGIRRSGGVKYDLTVSSRAPQTPGGTTGKRTRSITGGKVGKV